MSSSDNHRSSNDSTSFTSQRIPVEIFTMIFSYVGPPSAEKPYVYLNLSWVCRRWRSIMLETPTFWTVVRPIWSKTPDFILEIFRRSKSCPLDVFTCGDHCRHPDGCPGRYVISESSRIRSLFIQNFSLFNPDLSLLCPGSFPQLENLIFGNVAFGTAIRVLRASRPRFIQLSGDTLLQERALQNLSHIEWFKFHCDVKNNSSFLPFLKALQHLPNLRILNITITIPEVYYVGDDFNLPTANMPVVTLPNLRMLSLDLWNDQFHSICTPPTLDYVGLSRLSDVTNDWRFLDRIDLSTTKSFRVKLYDAESRLTCNLTRYLIACITMGAPDDDNNSDRDCRLFEAFHRKIPSTTLSSVESHLVLPPKNTFYIELHNFRDLDTTLSIHLKKAVNLVQLTLDYQSFKSDSDNKAMVSQLLSILDTVTHLKVVRCRNFSVICDILTKERTVPRLERLTYHSSCKPTIGTTLVWKRLRMMKNARVKLDCKLLKVLEMRNFVILSPQQIEKIEKMGIQFIQVL